MRFTVPFKTRSVAPPKKASARKEPVVLPVNWMLFASVRGARSSGRPVASGCRVPLLKVMAPEPIAALLPIWRATPPLSVVPPFSAELAVLIATVPVLLITVTPEVALVAPMTSEFPTVLSAVVLFMLRVPPPPPRRYTVPVVVRLAPA